MNHDRGCWKCGRDRWDYDSCSEANCAKEGLRKMEKRTPNVYIVQRQLRRNDVGQLVPKFELDQAEEFGQLVTLLDNRASPFRLKSVIDKLEVSLRDIQEGDYLLLVGNPALIGLSTAVAFKYVKRLCFLVWSAKEQRYIVSEAEI